MVRSTFLFLVIILIVTACAPGAVPAGSGVPTPAAPALAPVPPPLPGADTGPTLRVSIPAVEPAGLAPAHPRPVPLPAFERAPDTQGASQPFIPGTRVPILEYHYSTFRMSESVRMETGWFESQFQWLHDNGFTTLTAAQLVDFVHGEYTPPERSVVLTFDVGASKFDDYTTVVIPALRRYHFHGIFFLLAGRTLDSCADPGLTCWPRVKQWADEGLISVGSHSWSHRDYATLTPDQLYFDAARSKALIEEKTGHPVLGICYPFDSVAPAAFDLLEATGYQFAVGGYTRAERSATFADPQPYSLPRYYPYSGDFYPRIGGTGGLTFEQMVMGAIVR